MLNRKLLAAATFASLAALSAVAADSTPRAALDITQAIELVARTYPGRTIFAQTDPSGGDRTHYHVDVQLPNGNVAKFDVDARTQRIYNRVPPEAAPQDTISLADAVKKVQAQTRGRVMSAEFDPDPAPHYHMSVRLPKGKLTRVDLDLGTGKAAAHAPRT